MISCFRYAGLGSFVTAMAHNRASEGDRDGRYWTELRSTKGYFSTERFSIFGFHYYDFSVISIRWLNCYWTAPIYLIYFWVRHFSPWCDFLLICLCPLDLVVNFSCTWIKSNPSMHVVKSNNWYIQSSISSKNHLPLSFIDLLVATAHSYFACHLKFTCQAIVFYYFKHMTASPRRPPPPQAFMPTYKAGKIMYYWTQL